MVEFQHYGHINEMVWENAMPLRVNYWCLMYHVVSGTDINVKVDEVVKVSWDWYISSHSSSTCWWWGGGACCLLVTAEVTCGSTQPRLVYSKHAHIYTYGDDCDHNVAIAVLLYGPGDCRAAE